MSQKKRTKLDIPGDGAALLSNGAITIDLSRYNFSSANLGELRGRGYSGGSACIDLDNFEPSAAELFYRPPGPASTAGEKSSGPAEVGVMRLARFPNVGGAVPSAQVPLCCKALLRRTLAAPCARRVRTTTTGTTATVTCMLVSTTRTGPRSQALMAQATARRSGLKAFCRANCKAGLTV